MHRESLATRPQGSQFTQAGGSHPALGMNDWGHWPLGQSGWESLDPRAE